MDNEKSISVSSELESLKSRKKRDYLIILVLFFLTMIIFGYMFYDFNSKFNKEEIMNFSNGEFLPDLENSYFDEENNKLYLQFRYIGSNDISVLKTREDIILTDNDKCINYLINIENVNTRNTAQTYYTYINVYSKGLKVSPNESIRIYSSCYAAEKYGFLEGKANILIRDYESSEDYQNLYINFLIKNE